jgi:site-specific DNA recombinase
VRVIGYTRVSTQEQASEGASLAAQEERIRAWALANDAEVVDIVREEGVSGTKPLGERPAGARIAKLLDARKPNADAVVVVRMDRLGRDAAEQLALLKRFRTGKVGLVAIAQSIDLASAHGRALAGIGAVFSELERALISERTEETLADLREKKQVFNHLPFGWDAVEVKDEDGKVSRHLVENDDEQATLRRIRDLQAEGATLRAIGTILTDEGRATKRGGRWHAATVKKVLETSATIGVKARAV